MKEFDQRVKPLKDKNRKFLEKNVELTALNRNLKDQLRSVNDENKQLVGIQSSRKLVSCLQLADPRLNYFFASRWSQFFWFSSV